MLRNASSQTKCIQGAIASGNCDLVCFLVEEIGLSSSTSVYKPIEYAFLFGALKIAKTLKEIGLEYDRKVVIQAALHCYREEVWNSSMDEFGGELSIGAVEIAIQSSIPLAKVKWIVGRGFQINPSVLPHHVLRRCSDVAVFRYFEKNCNWKRIEMEFFSSQVFAQSDYNIDLLEWYLQHYPDPLNTQELSSCFLKRTPKEMERVMAALSAKKYEWTNSSVLKILYEMQCNGLPCQQFLNVLVKAGYNINNTLVMESEKINDIPERDRILDLLWPYLVPH
jgi:hypothetical protein